MYFKRVIWFQIALFPDHSLGIQIVLITIEGQIRLAKDDHVSLNNVHKIRHKTIQVIQCFIFCWKTCRMAKIQLFLEIR